LNLYHDYAADKTYSLIYGLVNATNTTGQLIQVRPTTSTESATNPTFAGYVVLDGDAPLIGGSVGEAHKASVTLKGAGTLNFYTSATA
jgi:hypothetical protein